MVLLHQSSAECVFAHAPGTTARKRGFYSKVTVHLLSCSCPGLGALVQSAVVKGIRCVALRNGYQIAYRMDAGLLFGEYNWNKPNHRLLLSTHAVDLGRQLKAM